MKKLLFAFILGMFLISFASLVVDGVIPYFIALIVSLAGGIIFERLQI